MWEQLVQYHQDLDAVLPRAAQDGGVLYAQRVLDRLHDTHTRTLVAEHEGRVVGFVLGLIVDLVPEMFEQEASGFLADIYVEEAYRSRGIGRRLVAELSAWFRSRGLEHMELYVASHNLSGRAFWESVGGREVMRRLRVDL